MLTEKVLRIYCESNYAGIERDLAKLRELGYEEDDELHPSYSAWLIRINDKTGKAERFLWDATNLKMRET